MLGRKYEETKFARNEYSYFTTKNLTPYKLVMISCSLRRVCERSGVGGRCRVPRREDALEGERGRGTIAQACQSQRVCRAWEAPPPSYSSPYHSPYCTSPLLLSLRKARPRIGHSQGNQDSTPLRVAPQSPQGLAKVMLGRHVRAARQGCGVARGTCPRSTGGGTRRVQLVRGEGRGVSS